MIQDRVYKLKKDHRVPNGVNFKRGQEFSIVTDVVYMEGYPLAPELQAGALYWITNNLTLFTDVTKEW